MSELGRRAAVEGALPEPEMASDLAISCSNPISIHKDLLDKFSNISSSVCTYGCFIVMLAQKYVLKYDDKLKAIEDIAADGLTLTAAFAEDFEAGTLGPITSMWQSLYSLATSEVDSIKSAVSGMSLGDMAMSFAKGMVSRYLGPIVAATAQNTVNAMNTELNNRKNLLAQIEKDIEDVKLAIEKTTGFEWWKALEAAIERAEGHVNSARGSIATAQAESTAGRWSATSIDKAQDQLIAAWCWLSSEAEQNELHESGEMTMDWRPYHGISPRSLWSKISESSKEIKDAIDRLRPKYECLIRLTSRLKLYQNVLFALEDLADSIKSLDQPDSLVTLDITGTDNFLASIRDRLEQISRQMKDVIENDRLAVAPLMVEDWRAEIYLHVNALRALGAMPSKSLQWDEVLGAGNAVAIPFQAETYRLSEAAYNDLKLIMRPHDPSTESCIRNIDFSQDTVLNLLSSFINVMGNFLMMMTEHDRWLEQVDLLKAEVRSVEEKDARAIILLEHYNGHDCEQFQFLVNFLKNSGLNQAYKNLISGRIMALMEAQSTLESVTSVVGCLASHIESFSNNMASMGPEAALDLENRLADEQAAALVANRNVLALPSLQFEFMSQFIDDLNKLAGDLTYISSLANGGIC